MYIQASHPMLPEQNGEERARHSFLIDLKNYLSKDLAEGNSRVYEEHARPEFEAQHQRPPRNRHEVAAVMAQQPYYRLWSSLMRTQQELYVDSTARCVQRQLPELNARYRQFAERPRFGSLTLDDSIAIPEYLSEVDIHCVPGGYLLNMGDDDVYAGARYDIGSFIFGRGLRGPLNDARGQTGVNFLKSAMPDLAPRRILDLGCAAGMNTLPYVDAYPHAEVHAIDVSASCLRYAHARAEALERPVHFSQQNAESTNFPDESFDVVVSHILFHESSHQAMAAFMQECHRLLSPGGVMLHLDVPRRITCRTPFDQFMGDWDTYNNNEPFWGSFLFDVDARKLAVGAGFADESIREEIAPTPDGKFGYWALCASKAGESK
ncbi:MAG: class I SAM-dependent methyltransferase [Gammaproteobacteria bacterium]|nr:class I SAM-dependent methyltransferase [Gammaproteobacteria bacterium]